MHLTTLTIADFLSYGRRYQIDYHFPAVSQQPGRSGRQHIAQGRAEAVPLAPGELIISDLRVLHPYVSRSRGEAALLIVVVVEGRVRLSAGSEERWLTAGEACNLYLDSQQILGAYQPAGQQLRTLCLALDKQALHQWCNRDLPSNKPFTWSLPNALSLPLKQVFNCSLTDQPRRLLFQGLALQLLAQGMASSAQPFAATRPANRLEAIYSLLEKAPGQGHRLEDLATQAAMSPSTLVRQFKAAYGCTPIDHLRCRRLERARELLLDGHSIQHAAHQSGYRHASNFTTAFRRAFGISPGDLAGSLQ